MAYQHERTSARKCAAQILYSGSIRGESSLKLLENGDIGCLDTVVSDYSYRLVKGVEGCKDELDERIGQLSKNWAIERMPLLDLAILRIALYEMLYVEEVPISVSINEAVEMAKAFGGDDDSPKFINGMLGSVARELEDEDSQ